MIGKESAEGRVEPDLAGDCQDMDVIDITDSADIADIASHDASWIADLRTVVVTEPDERVAARHLWAMLDRRRVDAAVAAPVVDLRRHRGRRAVAAATLTGVMMASGLGLAAAGQLPAPLQRVAAAAAWPFGLRLDPQRPPAHRRSPPPPDQSANSSETTTSGAPGPSQTPTPQVSGSSAGAGGQTGTGGGRSATAPGQTGTDQGRSATAPGHSDSTNNKPGVPPGQTGQLPAQANAAAAAHASGHGATTTTAPPKGHSSSIGG